MMIVLSVSTLALNSGQIGFDDSPMEASSGDEIVLTLKANAPSDVTGVEARIAYDSNSAEVISVDSLLPEDWGTDFLETELNDGEVFFSHSFIFGGTALSGEFDVASVTVRVTDSVEFDVRSVSLISGADNLATSGVGTEIVVGGAAAATAPSDAEIIPDGIKDTSVGPLTQEAAEEIVDSSGSNLPIIIAIIIVVLLAGGYFLFKKKK